MEIKLEIYPSSVIFFPAKVKVPYVVRKLRDNWILVFDLFSQWLLGCMRIAVATPEESDIFSSMIKEILEARDQGEEKRDEL